MQQYPGIFKYRRGVGCWLWKPYIILKTLEALDDGDVVFYMDAGTDIERDPTILIDLCVKNNGFLIFENRSGNPYGQIWKNNLWTKRDCFKLMNCDTDTYHLGNQSDGAYQVYQKNEKTVQFMQEYFNYCADKRIITDEPNTQGENLAEFLDHRHDQSVLSLLAIKYGLKQFPPPTEVGDSTRPADCPYKRVFLHHRGTIFGRR